MNYQTRSSAKPMRNLCELLIFAKPEKLDGLGSRIMAIPVIEFQHTQKKLLNFENWCNGKLSKSGHH